MSVERKEKVKRERQEHALKVTINLRDSVTKSRWQGARKVNIVYMY